MHFFLNLSTKAKLMVSFGIVIVLNLVIAVFTLGSLSNNSKIADKIDEVLDVAFTRIYTVQNAVEDAQDKFSYGLNERDNTYTVEQLIAEADSISAHLTSSARAIIPEYLGTPEYRDACITLRDSSLQADELIRTQVMPLVRDHKIRQAFDLYFEEVAPLFTHATRAAASIFRQQTQYCNNLSSQASDTSIIYINGALTIIAVILAVALTFIMSNYISRSLADQIKIIQQLAEGNFSEHIKQGHNDEFGHSHNVLRAMRNSLSDIIVMTKDECAKLQGEMRNLQDISHNFANMSNDIQNQAVTVAAAANQMVSTTQDIARNCETAAAGSNRCKEISSTGLDTVQQAIDNIRQQSDHTRDNAAKIESLAKQTNDIGSIVSTIDDIAAQTNLLALNAAIEAARAGEAGRGFAVVADEVRALASRTTASTQEISQMVKNVQAEAQMATESINTSVANMDTVAEDASHIMDIFNDISTHVSEVNTQITQIATAAEEQTTATSEISTHMQNISQMTGDMAQDADNQYKSMDSAYNDLTHLNKALAFFKTHQANS